MTLSEFVKKRKVELNLTWNDILDGGIANNTFSNIMNGKQMTMKPGTMEKLARVLKCTIGELQACMAEVPNPLRKEAERPEGTAGISITAKKVKIKKDEVDRLMREKPYVTAPDPEEPALLFRPEEEPEVDMMFPVEEVEPKETLAEFKARLTQMLLEEMLVTESSLTSLVLQKFGKRVVEELKTHAE